MVDWIDRDELRKDFCNMCEAMQPEMIDCEKKGCMSMQIIDEQTAVNRWIPCSERLPENRERVLVCFRSGTVHIAVWYGDYDEKGAWKVTSQSPTKLYRTDTIPKWMPLPEPPKGGAEDE